MPSQTKNLSELVHLPRYAAFLLEQKLQEFTLLELQLSREHNLPLLKQLEHLPEEKIFEIAELSALEFLSHLARNQSEEHITRSKEKWMSNRLPSIERSEVSPHDIAMINYIRKQAFLHFISGYYNDLEQVIQLIKEIDLFTMHVEMDATNTYINILKENAEYEGHIIQKINETIPGAVYVYDQVNSKGVYSNEKLGEIIGYSQEELNEESNAISNLVHPEDRELIRNSLDRLRKAEDREIVSYSYRIRKKNGEYSWLRSYESVFKRNEKGEVAETIGITLDVNKEMAITMALHENERLYKRAEAITHLGNYSWDLRTNKLKWSEELFRIYGLDPQTDNINFETIASFNYPEDTALVEREYKSAIAENRPFDFYYRIITKNKEHKILHARGELVEGTNGGRHTILGTVLDVTEKQTLIDKLRKTEAVYKQAEELANIGNWNWDIKNNRLEWTDQLYRIYGLEPQSEQITIERFLEFIDPEDRELVEKGVEEMRTKELLDYTFRIITPGGNKRIIRSVAHVEKNEQGEPVFVVGTERDITEKQTLIDQLTMSERLFKQAQSLAHLGNWTLDLITHEFTWSDEMYNIYELDKKTKIKYEEWSGFIHPDDVEHVLNYYEECLREKKQYDKVHRILLPGGTVKVIHRKGEFLRDNKGGVVKMIGTTQDVTKEYLVQQELKDNQTFIRKITDATPSIIASYNVNTGRYVFISEGLEKLLGYETKEVMERGVLFFADVIHPDDAGPIMEKNAKALQEANADPLKRDIVVEFTYRMKHKNGDYRWFHTYGTIFDRNNAGNVEHVLNISLDITEQVNATEKIKEQEHFIQQIADASPTILYLFDVKEQGMVYINREIFFVLGYSPDEIIQYGASVTSELYHPEDIPLLPCRKESPKSFQQVGSMIQYECRIRNKDGEWKWFLVREIVFKSDEEGHITQILGAALDINRRKDMEKTIIQNSTLLEQSNASLEEFAYVASHDLKEPLRKISTFGDRLVATQGDNMSTDGKIYLSKIIDASQRMQTMITDLLSVSMITGNTSFEVYSLQKILEETLQTLEFKLEQLNAIVKADPLPDAKIIPSQFRQLFQNLLSNSLKFVKPGVQPLVTISYSLVPADKIVHYQLPKVNHYHQLIFEDNGIGFDNEYAGKIFAIFQRLHGRSEYEGSGIGLAICKKIVEHHGGIIYARGREGEGATFTIILPG